MKVQGDTEMQLMCLVLVLAVTSKLGAASCPATAPIQSAAAVPWANTSWTVCESHVPGSPVLFIPSHPSTVPIAIERSAVPLYTAPTWLGRVTSKQWHEKDSKAMLVTRG